MPLNVLIFGASGFMMANLLPVLKSKYDFAVTAFVRPNSGGIPFLVAHGVKIVEGEWDNVELINKTVSSFDLVWEAGDSHDAALPKLLIPAMLSHAPNAALIRFTGTGNWITQTGGVADENAREYSDANADDIDAIHGQMFNGAGDLIAMDALKHGLNVWLLCTGGVYGTAPAQIHSAGVFTRLYTNNALQLGYCPYIGDGTAHMQLIHMDDVISATELFLDTVIPTIGQIGGDIEPHERFWNAPGYSVEWRHIAAVWEKVFEENLSENIPAKQVAFADSGFIGTLINAEMKSKASHLTARGWQPTGESIEEALRHILVRGTKLPLA